MPFRQSYGLLPGAISVEYAYNVILVMFLSVGQHLSLSPLANRGEI